MNKLIILVFGLLTNMVVAVETDEPEKEKRAYIGAGPYIQSQPYTDTDPKVIPSPVIFFDNELFYMRWTRVGVYVYGEDNWGVSLTAQPVPYGYQAADSPALAGMADRNSSWEGGVSIGGENDLGFAELTYFHDLLDNSNGSKLRLELGKFFEWGRWTAVPSVLAIWLSEDFNNYYYGVLPDEATSGRPAYTAGVGLNLAAQSYLKYDITDNWHILGNLRADYLNSTITDSPIVNDQWIVSGMISVLYSFPIKSFW